MDPRRCSSDVLFTMWSRFAIWHKHEKRIRGRHRRCREAWDKTMEAAIYRARKDKDERRVWKLMRILGGTVRRERKRNLRDVHAEDPTTTERQAAMREPGGDGGCEATTIRTTTEGEEYDRREVLRIEAPTEAQPNGTITDPATLLEVIQKMRYM